MKLDLNVTGMTCLDCSRHVTRALERVEGVTAATVDYRAGTATVEVAHPVAVAALVTAVERAGYHAESAPAGPSPTATSQLLSIAGPEAPSVRQPPSGAADFDILIIGTGGAGVAAAIQAAGMGVKVAIVEAGVLGGTCVNFGCIPSKNLIEAAARYHDAQIGFPGVAPCAPSLDWTAVLAQKNELVVDLRQAKYADVLASYPGVAILAGHAVLAGDGRVRVGDVEHRARKIIIATGASPSSPPIEGLEQVGALNSTTAMELEQLPASLLVIGGSAIGLELGQMFARFGVKVTIVELAQRILPHEDDAVSESLMTLLVEEGLEFHTGMTPTRIEKNESGVVLHVSQGSLIGELRAERVLIATGRRPNTDRLGLGDAGVHTTPKGYIKVDATMRSSNPDVYAAGDVTGGPGYVYVAAAGGRVAAENAVKSLAPTGTSSDEPKELDLSIVPNVTFTSPQVGSVGLSEANARAVGHNVQVSMLDMAQVPRAIVSRTTGGMVKIVADTASGRILGVHAVGPHAGDLMGEATLAVRFGLTARDIAGTLHPYLTWAESMKLAAQGFSMDVSKLSCCA